MRMNNGMVSQLIIQGSKKDSLLYVYPDFYGVPKWKIGILCKNSELFKFKSLKLAHVAFIWRKCVFSKKNSIFWVYFSHPNMLPLHRFINIIKEGYVINFFIRS